MRLYNEKEWPCYVGKKADLSGYKIKRWKCTAITPFSEAARGDVTGTCWRESPGAAAEPQRRRDNPRDALVSDER